MEKRKERKIMAKLYYNGHGSFRLTTSEGTVVYIDPYAGDGYEVPGDFILVTHQHSDHNRIDLPAKKPECKVIQNQDALINGEYQEFLMKDLKVRAVPAYNKNHSREECVGYMVKADGLLLYFAGDTSKIKEMEEFRKQGIDYALLPCDGVYNMDTKEASECAKIIGARYSIPVHVIPGGLYSREIAEEFHGPGRILLEPGTELFL